MLHVGRGAWYNMRMTTTLIDQILSEIDECLNGEQVCERHGMTVDPVRGCEGCSYEYRTGRAHESAVA